MLHLIRKGISEGCPVCGVNAFVPCTTTPPLRLVGEPMQLEMDLTDKFVEIKYLEFQVIQAIRRLRELHPGHVLVQTVAAVLKYQATDQSQR